MGPQHPSTHGVLRLILELDGETVTEARFGIGYLHTGIEKNLEYRTWTQGVTFVTRMDYLSPFFNETAYCLAVEKLLGITDEIPERASVIRVMLMELNRISSHLVALATGGMELGALTAMTFGFRERETVLDLFELITGLRMNHAYVRPGGLAQDLPPGAVDSIAETVTLLRAQPQGHRRPARRQRHLDGPHRGRRLPRPRRLHGAGHHRPDPARDRPAARPAQVAAVLRLRDLRLRRRHQGHLRRLRPVPDPAGRDAGVAEDRRAVPGPAGAGPGDGRRQEDRLAGAAGARRATAWATRSTTSGTSWASRWRP